MPDRYYSVEPIQGTTAMVSGKVNDLAIDELTATFDLDLNKVRIDDLLLRTAGGAVHGDGVVRYDGEPFVDASLSLDSVEGEGTTVTIRLPISGKAKYFTSKSGSD